MKKFLLMFAAVAAIAFVGCKTETKPAEEAAVEEAPVAEYTVDGVANDLLNCADEAAAVSLLDGIKAKAEELLNGGDQAGYFNIINILKTVWDNNKDAILAKIPTLAEKMTGYIDVPENLKAGFAEFVAKQAAEKVGEAVDAATDAATEKVDAAKEAVKDAAGNAVDAAKEKGAEAAQKVADELKN
jgi:NADH dehydrogenase/NADH:ubiquinone oxidoreductase subunit G